ncbi:unnamed protein product [Psylliodes chrysocephalus]|uniref:Uncharacterized protein n=1 Tax=Psylliodes chrysocephalus TaxID=3402493 RepID=A0A9P0GKQ3_9CUCU|nr:unnamed protein product [Psylliodes chrysocephala]
MVNRASCSNPVSRNRPAISCDGCKKEFHSVCITKNTDIVNLLNTIPGLFWKCSDCVSNYILLNPAGIQNLVDNKLTGALDTLHEEIKSIKSEVAKITEAEPPENQLRYSDVLKDKSQPVIIIQPKDDSQSHSHTKADILRNINPCQESIQLAKVKTVRDGGILIACKSKSDNEKVKSIVQQKMAEGYSVKEVGGVLKKIRIVGMTANLTSTELYEYIISCNSNVFSEESVCRIVKVFPTKKNNNIYQAIIQVDKTVYERALNSGNLFVAYDSCVVYDALEVYRCFKCNEFNHSAQRCTKNISCPVCGEAHDLKDCKSSTKKCSNCVKLKNTALDINHAVWERQKCSAYIENLNKLKSNLSKIN